MMFLVAFAAKEAWRQDLEVATELGMVFGSISPAGRAGWEKDVLGFAVQCRAHQTAKQTGWEHLLWAPVVNIDLASVSSTVGEHPQQGHTAEPLSSKDASLAPDSFYQGWKQPNQRNS